MRVCGCTAGFSLRRLWVGVGVGVFVVKIDSLAENNILAKLDSLAEIDSPAEIDSLAKSDSVAQRSTALP